MSLVFGANANDGVSYGNLDGVEWTQTSFLIWYYRTSNLDQIMIGRKLNGAGLSLVATSNAQLQVFWSTSSTSLSYATADNFIPSNTWLFSAFTIDKNLGSNQCKMYHGSLSSAVADITPTGSDGDGTFHSIGDRGFCVGNNANLDQPFYGSIAVASVVGNRVLTLAEIRQFQYRPAKYWSEQQVFSRVGHNGTTNVRDLSGHGNTGTITGTTVGADLPIGPWFGFDLGWQGSVQSRFGVLTGTGIGGITEADVVAGGKTVIATLTGDTFILN